MSNLCQISNARASEALPLVRAFKKSLEVTSQNHPKEVCILQSIGYGGLYRGNANTRSSW